MSKVVVRIKIPLGSPDKLLSLGNSLENYHKSLADDSPLGAIDMELFGEKLKLAEEKRELAKKLMGQAEILMQEANLALGIEKGQNSRTQGTIINTIIRIRDFLKGLNRGQEETLSLWGFKVVVSTVVRSKNKKAGKSSKALKEQNSEGENGI